MSKVYELVTTRILAEMEKGIIPWVRPWQGSHKPVNWSTGRAYRGINRLLSPPGEYATFNQIKNAGGRILKGEKSHLVTFWKKLEKKDEETGETNTIPFLRYYNVFEINTQCEGLTSKYITPINHNPAEQAQAIVENYTDRPLIKEGTTAYYEPTSDKLFIPNLKTFFKIEEYYKVLFHELIHSTGHSKRLNRPTITQLAAFGSAEYSKEELIAELGASFLAGEAGLNYSIENTAAYLQSWIKIFKNDSKMLVYAASAAEKASDYILNNSLDLLNDIAYNGGEAGE